MYKHQRMLRRALLSNLSMAVAVTSVGLVPQVAMGQAALEEVVVTARKRAESLQETPIAVSAFSGDSLTEMGMSDLSDLRNVVPNVDVYEGNGTTGAGNIFIRGVGARNTGVNFDSGVGIYVDGVYVSRPDGAIMDNVDVQSVEVLRGPQGTLFGKNTTGGAILYTTNKPNEEFGGHAEVRAGNYNRMDGKLTLNVPLIGDTLMSRLSVYATTRDGYVEAVPTNSQNRAGLSNDEYSDVDRKGAQAQLRWVPSADLVLDLNYNYSKTDQAARGQNCEVVSGVPGAGWQADAQDSTIIIPSTGQSISDWCAENQALGKDRIQADLQPNKYEAEVNSLSFVADWEVTENMSFKSITSGRNTEGGETNELDAIGIGNLGRSNYGHPDAELRSTDAFSQEFTLSGTAFSDKLDYVVGIFGFYEETDQGTAVSPSGPFFNTLNSPTLAFYINQTTELLTENSSASAFTQVDWNFNDALKLTLGLRYTWEERELTRKFRIPDTNTLSTGTPASVSVFSDTIYNFPDGETSFNPDHLFVVGEDPDNPGQPDPLADQTMVTDNSEVTPMASIQYLFDTAGFVDSASTYFTVANGFLSGGISDTTDVETREVYEYDPEKVWNYELGAKMEAFDYKLRLNAALFHTRYKDRQLTTVRINPDTGRIAGAIINAESSQITGIELESIYIPIENLMLIANVTFNEGDIDTYDDERILAASGATPPPGCDRINIGIGDVDNCDVDRSDENLPRLPDQIYYLAVQYNWMTDLGTVTPFVSWSYRRNVDNCFDRASCLAGLYEVDQEDLSARLTWMSPEESWRVTAFGSNLTDERYVTGGTPLVDVTETAGTIYNLPRTYGVEAAYTW